jgi:hypothetical protein
MTDSLDRQFHPTRGPPEITACVKCFGVPVKCTVLLYPGSRIYFYDIEKKI